MKIVTVLGSPRHQGNSAGLARKFCELAERYGAEVQTFALNRLEYRGCQGCLICKTQIDRCGLQDDLADVLEAVRHADLLLMASPIYFGDVSSQMKGFIDRTFGYLVPDYATNPSPSRLAPGKKLLFILVQGNPDDNRFDDVYPRYNSFFQWYGFSESHLVRVCGAREAGEALTREKAVKRLEDLAEIMCNTRKTP